MENKKLVHLEFDLIQDERDCMGMPNPCLDEELCQDINVEFTEEEIETIKKLVAESKHDTEMNLMFILEDKAPELYRRIEEKMLDCSREIWWHYAVSEGGVSYDDDLFKKNYLHDIETGDFKPSVDFVPEGDYDKEGYEDMEYIEWYERERERMEYEDAQWFRERYNETFEDIDLSDEKYFCYIPEEFLPET